MVLRFCEYDSLNVMWQVVWLFCEDSVVDQLIHSDLLNGCFLSPQSSLQGFKITAVRNIRQI